MERPIIIAKATANTPEVKVWNDRLYITGKLIVPQGMIENDFFDRQADQDYAKRGLFVAIHLQLDYLDASARTSLIRFLQKLAEQPDERVLYWTYEEDDEAMKRLMEYCEERLPEYVFSTHSIK